MKPSSCWSFCFLGLALSMLSCVTALHIEETNVAAMVVVAADDSLLVLPVAATHMAAPVAGILEPPTSSRLHNMTFQEPALPPTASSEESLQDSPQSFPNQNPPNSFQERLDDVATDIIICTLVAAFVALQYRDIIQTCQ